MPQSRTAYRDQFIARVTAARQRWGGTQADLATLLSISQPTYSKYESRGTLMPHHLLLQFCRITRADLAWLLGDESTQPGALNPTPASGARRRRRRAKV